MQCIYKSASNGDNKSFSFDKLRCEKCKYKNKCDEYKVDSRNNTTERNNMNNVENEPDLDDR